MKAIVWTIIFFTLMTIEIQAQSDLLFNNYQINAIARNPAAIESNGLINAYLGAHQQWIGFEDAPNMQWGQVSTFFDKHNMGVSLNISNQSEGVALTQNVKLGYAYHVNFKAGHQLHLGIGAGIYFRKLDYSKLRFGEEEQDIPVSDQNTIRPDFDFGFEYLFGQFKAGVSANHITVFNKNATLYKIPLQTQAYMQYQWEVSNDISLTPGAGYFSSGTISAFGLSADFAYKQLFGFGLEYRNGQSFIFRAGLHLTELVEIRYAYDMGAGTFAKYQTGIHEVVLIGRFNKHSTTLNSPRFIDN